MRILFIVKLDEVLLTPSHSTIKLLPTCFFFFFFYGKHIVLPLQLFLHFLYSLGAALYSILCVLSLLVLSSAALQSRPLPPPLSSPFSLSWDFLLVINIFVSRLSRCSHRSQLLLPICWLDTHGPCSWTHQRLPAVPPTSLPPCVVHLRPLHRGVFSQDDGSNYRFIQWFLTEPMPVIPRLS